MTPEFPFVSFLKVHVISSEINQSSDWTSTLFICCHYTCFTFVTRFPFLLYTFIVAFLKVLLNRYLMLLQDTSYWHFSPDYLTYFCFCSCHKFWLNSGCIRQHTVTNHILLFSHSFVSDSLWSHGLQHTRLPCPSPSPRVVKIHVHWVVDVIQLFHSLSSSSPPAFNLSQPQGLY